MKPLLSIVIPTRNRQQYCIAAIEHILSLSCATFELCVQDNSDDNQIEKYIANHPIDQRLVYNHVSHRLNSVHNMDAAISMATGLYVIMIGDDDTILPEIFDIVEWARCNNVDSLCARQSVVYYWPGAYPGAKSGIMKMIIPAKSNKDDWSINRKLDKLFSKGITRFLDYKLPKIYHGLIRRDRLQEVKAKTGHYFGGLSPDIYSTIALCSVVQNHIILEQAITVMGACRASATSQNINKGHRGELSQAPHLVLRGPYIWDDYVPAYYSVETIWAESAMKAIREMEMTTILKKFNFSYLVAFSALNNRNIFLFAMKKSLSKENYFIAESRYMKIKILWAFMCVISSFICRIIKRNLRMTSQQSVSYENLENISQAVEVYQKKSNKKSHVESAKTTL